jgi:hypothetical protein
MKRMGAKKTAEHVRKIEKKFTAVEKQRYVNGATTFCPNDIQPE